MVGSKRVSSFSFSRINTRGLKLRLWVIKDQHDFLALELVKIAAVCREHCDNLLEDPNAITPNLGDYEVGPDLF